MPIRQLGQSGPLRIGTAQGKSSTLGVEPLHRPLAQHIVPVVGSLLNSNISTISGNASATLTVASANDLIIAQGSFTGTLASQGGSIGAYLSNSSVILQMNVGYSYYSSANNVTLFMFWLNAPAAAVGLTNTVYVNTASGTMGGRLTVLDIASNIAAFHGWNLVTTGNADIGGTPSQASFPTLTPTDSQSIYVGFSWSGSFVDVPGSAIGTQYVIDAGGNGSLVQQGLMSAGQATTPTMPVAAPSNNVNIGAIFTPMNIGYPFSLNEYVGSPQNLIMNPSVEVDATNWESYNYGGSSTSSARTTSDSYIGAASYEYDFTANGSYNSGIILAPAVQNLTSGDSGAGVGSFLIFSQVSF